MHLNMKWTIVLNPGQTPVDVSDQPVCALTKELQFCHPEIFYQHFTIFRQLRIEQSLLVIQGQSIEGSELVQILTENKFSMIGLSSVIDVINIKRYVQVYLTFTFQARDILQVTLWALFMKFREAASVSETDLPPYDWLTQKSKDNISFLYWKCVIDLPVKALSYVNSIRESNFKLHVKVSYKLLS